MASELDPFDHQIQQRLEACTEGRAARRSALASDMEILAARQQAFDRFAERTMSDIILPAMTRLVDHFENAHLRPVEESASHHCVCSFGRTPRFPASVTLEITLGQEAGAAKALVGYHLQIVPVFFRFEGHDVLTVPVADGQDSCVGEWLHRKLLQFVDDYLKLETLEPYQRENQVIDPVCGMRINKADAVAQTAYRDITYYFCVQGCYQQFADNPSFYATEPNQP